MFCNIVGELVGFTELGDTNQHLTEFEAHLKNGTAPIQEAKFVVHCTFC